MIIEESQIEIDVKNKEKNKEYENIPHEEEESPNREELLQYLEDHLKHAETMPPHVRQSFVTYLDLEAILNLIFAIFKAKS